MMVDIKSTILRYNSLLARRSQWDVAWKELADHFLPLRMNTNSYAGKDQRGGYGILNNKLMDSTGVLDMRTLAAGLHGGMTNPSRQWFSLKIHRENFGLYADPPVSDATTPIDAYIDDVSEAVRIALRKSNFYNSVHSLYSDLATFGTALMLETMTDFGLMFDLARPGDYVLDSDGRGKIDTFFRRISMNARQLIKEFGKASLPPSIASLESRSPDTEMFTVVHGVFPRDGGNASKIAELMPYASVYWLEEASGASGCPLILKESGFKRFPAFCPRWDALSGEAYGRSPAMDVLPDCRMLQGMVKTLRKMQHTIADPPLAVDATLMGNGVALTPGGLNYVQSGKDASGAIVAIQQPEPAALEHTMRGVDSVRDVIHAGLYADLLKSMLEDQRSQVTAEEVATIRSEKMLLIGPVLERLEFELLTPLICRSVELLEDAGIIPPPPDEIADAKIYVAFHNALGT